MGKIYVEVSYIYDYSEGEYFSDSDTLVWGEDTPTLRRELMEDYVYSYVGRCEVQDFISGKENELRVEFTDYDYDFPKGVEFKVKNIEE